ncbi:DNA-directed RNA polymerase III subunit RPC10 [Lobulomyces angularis]|nr:DNA-directed RNA polymerase III subunit RPC10 [Lobulomyces angularis]
MGGCYFCPCCSNLLLIQTDDNGKNTLVCQTCPYISAIFKPIINRKEYKRKQLTAHDNQDDLMKDVDIIEVTCPKCEYTKSYKIDIRLDTKEVTSFYKCTSDECGLQWRK